MRWWTALRPTPILPLPTPSGERGIECVHIDTRGSVLLQLPHPPRQRLALGVQARFGGQQQFAAVEAAEALEVGDAAVEARAHMPAQVGAGRDQVAVHRPVHVGGERDAVARVVVAGLGEGVEVRGLHHRLAARQQDAGRRYFAPVPMHWNSLVTNHRLQPPRPSGRLQTWVMPPNGSAPS